MAAVDLDTGVQKGTDAFLIATSGSYDQFHFPLARHPDPNCCMPYSDRV
jgi:hypothetical protein